jgi:GNAT superfamily N-acetyltransferase
MGAVASHGSHGANAPRWRMAAQGIPARAGLLLTQMQAWQHLLQKGGAEVELVLSSDYELAVAEIKRQMLPYYEENDLVWDDYKKLELYRKCALWAIFDEREVGFIMFHERVSQLFLAELHIAPEHRNQGYGSKALAKAKEHAVSLGYARIRIEVFKSSPAYALYLRSGFLLEAEELYTYQLVSDVLLSN